MLTSNKFWAAALLAALGVLTTCSNPMTGLGPRIDVFPPTVSIESPSAGINLRGVFQASGSVKDDIQLKEVRFSLVNSLDGQAAYSATANLSGTQWTVSVDSTMIPDGSYTLLVSAEDSTGKVSQLSTLIVIPEFK